MLGTGSGQTRSLVSSWQNSLISLYRYHCLAQDNPEGEVTGGRTLGDGIQLLSMSILKLLESESLNCFKTTLPRLSPRRRNHGRISSVEPSETALQERMLNHMKV